MKLKEIIAIIFVGAFLLMMFLGFMMAIFFGMNWFFSQDACMREGYNLYKMGSVFPKGSPICEYLNETTMEVEYIKLSEEENK